VFQAPEVDGITYIESANLMVGQYVDVRIKEAYAYDLKGEIA
jgi:ribosomal protein S12 methylthiotransferase